MTSNPNTTTLTSGSRANRGVFTRSKEQGFTYGGSLRLVPSHSHSKQAFVYSDPSVSVSGHSTSSIEDNRSSIVDDQQSTEPIPLDLDYKSTFVSSPPPLTLQDAPVTRARARAQARNNFTDGSASPPLKPESPRANPDDDEYNLPESGNNDGGDGDDDYQLSESDNIHDDSEIVDEIIGRKKTNKKPVKAKYSSRLKGKQVANQKAVPITTKKVSRLATKRTTALKHKHPTLPKQASSPLAKNNTPQDEPLPARQVVENPEGSGDQEVADVISDSQCTSQELLSPQKPRPRGPNSRRPKKPFYPGNLQPAPSAHSTISIHQQPTAGQENTTPSSPDRTELREDRAIPTNPIRRNNIDLPQLESSRTRGNNGAKFPVSKGNDHGVHHNQLIVTANEVNNSPIRTPFDQNSQPNVGKYQCLQGSPSYPIEAETGKRPDDSESNKQPAKKAKLGPVIKQSSNNADASTQPSLPQPSSSPTYYLRIGRTNNETTQTEVFEDEPFPRDLYHQERQKQGEEEGQQQQRQEMVGNNTTFRFSGSPQTHAISGLSWGKLATTEAGKAAQKAERIDHFSSFSDTEESLHPRSIAWAQRISERSRQKKLVSTLSTISEEIPPLQQTPITTRDDGKNQTRKPETAVAGARGAVSESLQEMATGLVQHLKSKESVSNTIVDSYKRNGRKLVDRLLDHQSNELCRYIAAFDRKCLRLANMYSEAARLVSASSEKSLRQNEEYGRAWQERVKENDEDLKRAWEAVASLKSLRRRG